jgi:hypothetical protein
MWWLVDATGDGIVHMEIELQNQHVLTTATPMR